MQIDKEYIVARVTQELKKAGIIGSQAGAGAVQAGKVCTAPTDNDILQAFEHSMLQKDVNQTDIAKACSEAIQKRVGAIVVPIWQTEFAAKCLKGSSVRLVTAISFPNGGQSIGSKLQEVREALANNVDEIDVVPNFDMILRGKIAQVRSELEEIIAIAKPRMKVKINIEWGFFTDEQKVEILNMAASVGADFVKVQHFLAGGKAEVEEVRFIRAVAGSSIGIKIDTGIKTAAFCRELMQAGANRMGLTATFKIISEELNCK
jgi:deoxyribose-phosphate aldolase